MEYVNQIIDQVYSEFNQFIFCLLVEFYECLISNLKNLWNLKNKIYWSIKKE